MTAFRLISLPFHAALELLIGLGLMAVPVALGLSTAAAVVGFVVGAVVVGLALSATVTEVGGLDIAAHHAFDLGLAFGLMGAGLVFGLSGDLGALAVFAAAAVGQMALNLTTRYSLPH